MTIKLPDPAGMVYVGNPPNLIDYYTHAQLVQAVKDALDEAVQVADEYATDQWNLYKGRPPYDGSEGGRASPYTEGLSDGANECADAIRAMKKDIQ